MASIDFRKKICLIGDPSVGKTSLIQRFVYDKFDERYLSTMGVKVSKKVVEHNIEGNHYLVSLQIWDTMGQREFRPLLTKYFKGAEGALVVCDITQKQTLASAGEWAKLILSVAGRIPIVFLANKVDLHKRAAFSPSELDSLVKKHGHSFFPTSAKTGTNVETAFETLSKVLIEGECASDPSDDLRAVARRIAAKFADRNGGEETALPMIKQQFKRANLDYERLECAPITVKKLECVIENLVEITRAFKGDDVARADRLEFIKILKRV